MKGPKILRVRPHLPYKLLGTDIQLDPEKVYDAVRARHIPGWKEKQMVFVEGILLEAGEYTLIK